MTQIQSNLGTSTVPLINNNDTLPTFLYQLQASGMQSGTQRIPGPIISTPEINSRADSGLQQSCL